MATNTYVALRTQTVPTATTSVTFDLTGISGYKDLILISATGYTATNTGQGFGLRFNNDAGTNYSTTIIEGDGTNPSSYRGTNQTSISFCAPSNGNQNFLTPIITHIFDYANTTTQKTILSKNSGPTFVTAYSGIWRASPTAITSITIIATGTSGNIRAGSTFSLYGISDIGDATPKATGGDVTSDATYWYHTFTMSGNFIPNQSLSCEYLVVGGGGGSSIGTGGGGGAGGYRTSIGGSPLSVTAQNYPILVGAGGSAGNGTQTAGASSTFSTITSAGGGRGGSFNFLASTGGSGGGGTYGQSGYMPQMSGAAGNTPSTSPSQGNNGGDGRTGEPSFGSGGGGGAGAVGGTASTTKSGDGGAGSNSASTWASVTGTGVSGFYAGGGGGGADASRTPTGIGLGGSGGGGNGGGGAGAPSTTGFAGVMSTGGGAGGGGSSSGANGGSGIVIIRYTKA